MNSGTVNIGSFLALESYLIEKEAHLTLECVVRFSANANQITTIEILMREWLTNGWC